MIIGMPMIQAPINFDKTMAVSIGCDHKQDWSNLVEKVFSLFEKKAMKKTAISQNGHGDVRCGQKLALSGKFRQTEPLLR